MKRLLIAAVLTATSMSSWAGGLLTNTNQNIAFNRMMSREASIGIDGVYSNPAGVAFLQDGLHLSLNWQMAIQSRIVKNNYKLFENNTANPTTSREFKGKAFAPVVPSIQAAYNTSNWSFQMNFSLVGGGGKCKFDNGLGSFERAVSNIAFGEVYKGIIAQQVSALVPSLMAQGLTKEQAVAQAQAGIMSNPDAMQKIQQGALANAKYTMNAYMRGRQYYFGLSLGAAYKFNEQLAGFAGVRGVYGTTNYYGYVNNITVAGKDAGMEIALNCDQSGIGFTPIIGIDYKPNEKFNLSARYEFKTRMRLKNQSVNKMPELDAVKEALAKFEDGKSIPEDIPALLTVGAGYSPMESLRLNIGAHYFFDKQATMYNDVQKKLDRGTIELNAGAEYDINKKVTVSAGWQNTNYGITDEYMDDKSFVVNSNSIGCGACIHLSDKVDLNVAYFTTLYGHK
ncbi:MAG: hypothetical protein HUK07_04805, partial [Bacteroidaceae bacterium]|nr:hypothetical protein [Bacteroidaceae bacterium]